MDPDPFPLYVDIILILALVFLNGFFVSIEFAMVKVRGTRIDTLVQEGNPRAKFASRLTGNLDAYLSACQLGITLASLGLGWIGEPAIARALDPVFRGIGLSESLIHPLAFIIGFTLITILHIVLGELAPKTLAIRQAETVTLWASAPLIVFRKIMSPFIWLLNGMANRLLKLIGIEPASEDSSAHTEEEIRILMKESHKSGLIDKTELTLVDNIFDFAETNAREIMIPRTEMICLYANHPFEENRATVLREMHTRYPVCEKDKDNIIGFVHIRDLLKDADCSVQDIRQLLRPLLTVPESMPISNLLKLMQKNKSQIAILIDEYGGTSGLVTLEDIMEEIVGEIQDEFDEERPDMEKKDDQTYSISGMMLIEEVNSYFGLEIPTEDYDTIGGWVYSQIENPPRKNQTVEVEEGIRFIIEETDHLRISRIFVVRDEQVSAWEPQESVTG
ncbi:hemolysin family protein [Cohnella thailandensis]|uniref:HlyC/CorC family transporter n=1 Tax=Cohnella thailandensis TaxID=557557 RepID=A0A841SUV0_9BACL|nr:hemolysin family protein [Cohnella thailandensis]MBB6633978.1 HlyC/CorC family transporter [Cohnella thailandensis]MBP1972661.1 CBS domain containing-hemolysin-like protein [Cohnella thailandensis]